MTDHRSRKRQILSFGPQSNFESDDEPIITKITRVDDPIAVITLDEEVSENFCAELNRVTRMRCIQPDPASSKGNNPQPSTGPSGADLKPSIDEDDDVPIMIPSPILLGPDEVGCEPLDKQSSDESSSIKSTEDGDVGNEASSPLSEASNENGIDLVVPTPTIPSTSEEASEDEGDEESDS
jgi:hypothetical protein